MLARSFAVAPDTSQPAPFSDVPSGAAGYGEIQALTDAGALQGCTATTFCPDGPIDRESLAWALAVLAGISGSPGPAQFGDIASLDPARAGAINALAAAGDVDGCAPDSFCPAAPATRAVGAAWMVRTAKIPPAPGL